MLRLSLLRNRGFSVIRDGGLARLGLRPDCGKGFRPLGWIRKRVDFCAHPRRRRRWGWWLIDRDLSQAAFRMQTRPRRDSQEMY